VIWVVNLIHRIVRWLTFRNIRVKYRARIGDLKRRGMKVGKNVIISPSARIDENYPYLISIGNNCVIGPNVRLLTHDSTLNMFNGNYMKVARITIKDNCVISMNSTILPGVTIGPDVLVATGSVVNKDIPPNTCVAGVPARYYGKFSDLIERSRNEIKSGIQFEAVDLARDMDEKDKKRKKKIIQAAERGPVFIKGFEAKNPVWLEGVEIKNK